MRRTLECDGKYARMGLYIAYMLSICLILVTLEDIGFRITSGILWVVSCGLNGWYFPKLAFGKKVKIKLIRLTPEQQDELDDIRARMDALDELEEEHFQKCIKDAIEKEGKDGSDIDTQGDAGPEE